MMTDLILAQEVPFKTWRGDIWHRDLTIRLCDYCGSQIVGGRLKRGYRTCSVECNQKYWDQVKKQDRLSNKRSPTFWATYRHECLERDKYICQDCGAKENSDRIHPHEVHHIVPIYRGGTNQLENLITLCHECHRIRHLTRPPVMDPAQQTMDGWI